MLFCFLAVSIMLRMVMLIMLAILLKPMLMRYLEVLAVMLMILAILLKAMLLTYLDVLVVTPVARSESRWSMECEDNGKEIVGISLVSLCLP